MRQLVGWRDEERTVRDLLLSLSEPRVRRAGAGAGRGRGRERRATPGERTGLALARGARGVGRRGRLGRRGALGHLHDDRAAPVARPRRAAGGSSTLSGGEQKRLALEVAARGPTPTCCCSTSPTTTSTSPGKEWLEDSLRACPKTILLISHDRALLAARPDKVVTLEGPHRVDARRARSPPGTRLATNGSPASTRSTGAGRRSASASSSRCSEFRRRAAMGSDKFASRVRRDEVEDRAVRSRRRRPIGSEDQAVSMRLGGDRTGKRVVVVRAARAATGSPTRSTPRSCSASGSRCSVRTAPARATSSRLLAGEPVDHDGTWRARRARRARLLLADPRPTRARRRRGARRA